MKVKATFTLDTDLLDRLRAVAEESGASQASILEDALRAALGGKREPKVLRQGPEAAFDLSRQLRSEGLSLAKISRTLNRRGYRTSRGRPWNVVNVSRLLAGS